MEGLLPTGLPRLVLSMDHLVIMTCVFSSAQTGTGYYQIYVTGLKVKPKHVVKTTLINGVVLNILINQVKYLIFNIV